MQPDRDIVLIIKGGTIQGVFGSGVMVAFQRHNLYPRIHSIYAVSSGAHNAAYFLSKKSHEAASVYYDRLYKKHSFLKDLSFKIICRKFWDLFIHNKSFDIVDLDYVENIERKEIPLDVEKIKNSPINFYVRVFNPKTLKLEYLDGKVDTISRLIQSAKVPPYAFTKIKNDKYLDGGIMPTRDFIKNVVKKFPDKTIIYIFNDKKTVKRVLQYLPWDLLDVLFKTRYLGIRYGIKHLFSIFNYPYVVTLKKYKHVHVLYDTVNTSKRERSRERIIKSYEHGIRQGENVLKKLNHIKY
ncbi:patatin-like phospholipase family protein [Patescibacteria group bacterium]|nr:patatin-like phospholipase family protein [Patescibacteria group bacterium]